MRIVVVDDHQLVRDGIISLLESVGHTVIGECGDGQSAIQLAQDLQPDLVLMDINMPVMNGLSAMCELKSLAPHIKVVMLTITEEEECLVQAIQDGADGYLNKSASGDEFLESLKALEKGEMALSRSMATRVIMGLIRDQNHDKPCDRALTNREIEILQLVAAGNSNKAIGELISVSENTVKYHLKKILQKLNAQNRTEAVSIGLRLGLLNGEAV